MNSVQSGRSTGPNANNGVAWWRILAWQLYDFAETAWSMNIYSLYFGMFILEAFDRNSTDFGWALTIANLTVAVSSPLLGAMSDASQRRLPFLRFFVLGAALMTALIGVASSFWIAVLVFIIAYFCANSAYNFYQALLPGLANETNVSKVSGIGVALGYMGSITGVLIMKAVTGDDPNLYYLVFPATALIYFLFSLPVLTVVPDFAPPSQKVKFDIGDAYRRMANTFAHARQYPGLFRFLIADFIYENAVSAVIGFMAVYAKVVVGVEDITTFFVASTAAAVLFGLIFGPVVDRIGPKRSVLITLGLWLLVFPAVSLVQTEFQLALIGPFAGMGLAAVWISSRTYLIALAPIEKSGEFFGLYSLSGKSAGVAGVGIWTLVLALLTGPVGEVTALRSAVWVMWVFMLVGFTLVVGLPDARPTRANVLDRSQT